MTQAEDRAAERVAKAATIETEVKARLHQYDEKPAGKPSKAAKAKDTP